MLGPLVNPSQPRNQIVGVYDLELARLYQYVLQETDTNYTIIHNIDGYDEIALTDKVKLISNDREEILSPHDLGFKASSSRRIIRWTICRRSYQTLHKDFERKWQRSTKLCKHC